MDWRGLAFGPPALTVRPPGLAVVAGDSLTVPVRLNGRPTGPVTVTAMSSDAGIVSAVPAALAFDATNWNVDQPVTLTAARGSAGHVATISLLASGGGFDEAAARMAMTVLFRPPEAPEGVAALADDRAVLLRWPDPGDRSITGYQVRTSADGGASWGAWTAIRGSGARTTSHRVEGLANDVVHGFEIRALNRAEAPGAASPTVTATPAAPAVIGVLFTSAGPYGLGERIEPVLRLSGTVTVAGAPRLALDIGGTVSMAAFTGAASAVAGGRTFTDLRFAYVVEAGDYDADGIGIASDALDLDDAAVTGIGGTPADTVIPRAIANITGHAVDGGPPIPALRRGIRHASGAYLTVTLYWSSEPDPKGRTLTGWELDTLDAGAVASTQPFGAASTGIGHPLNAGETRSFRVRAVYGGETSPNSAEVSSALGGETMRVAIDVAAEGNDLYNEGASAGAIHAGTFATGDGMTFNRAWRNSGNNYLYLFRAASSTISVADYVAANAGKSLYLITAGGVAELAVSEAVTAASYIRFDLAAGSSAQALVAGIGNGDDIAFIIADAGAL